MAKLISWTQRFSEAVALLQTSSQAQCPDWRMFPASQTKVWLSRKTSFFKPWSEEKIQSLYWRVTWHGSHERDPHRPTGCSCGTKLLPSASVCVLRRLQLNEAQSRLWRIGKNSNWFFAEWCPHSRTHCAGWLVCSDNAISAEVAKMHRQVALENFRPEFPSNPLERQPDWKSSNSANEARELWFCASAFHSTRCLEYVAEQLNDPELKRCIRHCFYVDDLLCGSHCPEAARSII